jgi:putative ABC transport system permease protein
MFILSKQIIEKNTQSISMTKILGFTNSEIGGLYIIATSIVVILSLLISIPIIDVTLRWIFSGYLYKEITGYFPYIVSNNCYIAMVVLGIVSYAVIAVFQMIKINRIPKSDALKNVE